MENRWTDDSENELMRLLQERPEMAEYLMQALGGQLNAPMAETLAMTKQPTGQTVGPLGGYVAANPLEHLSAALDKGRGIKQHREGITAQQDSMKALLEALRGDPWKGHPGW